MGEENNASFSWYKTSEDIEYKTNEDNEPLPWVNMNHQSMRTTQYHCCFASTASYWRDIKVVEAHVRSDPRPRDTGLNLFELACLYLAVSSLTMSLLGFTPSIA